MAVSFQCMTKSTTNKKNNNNKKRKLPFYCSIVDLQCCVSFRYKVIQINMYMCTCVYSFSLSFSLQFITRY